jgi:hypothetical protein
MIERDVLLEAHQAALEEVGELSAPPGSRLWAIAVKAELLSALIDIAFRVEHLRSWRDSMQWSSGYRQLVDEHGQPFETYEDFCRARPPFGLGCEPTDIDRFYGSFSTTIPINTPKEVAQDLIKIYNSKQLREIRRIIGEALSSTDRP